MSEGFLREVTCHTNNWAGNEYCKECGAAMDIIIIASVLFLLLMIAIFWLISTPG